MLDTNLLKAYTSSSRKWESKKEFQRVSSDTLEMVRSMLTLRRCGPDSRTIEWRVSFSETGRKLKELSMKTDLK
jgi:hypothetical protein